MSGRERYVDAQVLRHFHYYIYALHTLEALCFRADLIDPRLQIRGGVVSRAIGGDDTGRAALNIGNDYRGTGHGSAGLIANAPENAAGRGLGKRENRDG